MLTLLPASLRDDVSWIQTYTGRRVWPLSPEPDDFCIEDIAHGLSNLCRYVGHTKTFYSVAQHCVLCAYYAPKELQREALMHDAAEAYISDIARPVKRKLVGYAEIETNIETVIAKKFGLTYPWSDEIHEIDLRMLATERRDLMATPPVPWISTEGLEPFPGTIVTWTPYVAEKVFLNYAQKLKVSPVKVESPIEREILWTNN